AGGLQTCPTRGCSIRGCLIRTFSLPSPMPPRLSVAIVCRDNIGTIGRTVESVSGLADEIVAVDSGSTDGTIELLEAAGARVLHTDWKGHVATKQMALEACGREWILCLDSDESP